MRPTEKAAIERMIMRIEANAHVPDGAIVEGVTSEGDIMSPDHFRAMIEDAISRYHAEAKPGPAHTASAAWSVPRAPRRGKA
jgi:hypothetical protein